MQRPTDVYILRWTTHSPRRRSPNGPAIPGSGRWLSLGGLDVISVIIQTFMTRGVFFSFFNVSFSWPRNQIKGKYLPGWAWDWFRYPTLCGIHNAAPAARPLLLRYQNVCCLLIEFQLLFGGVEKEWGCVCNARRFGWKVRWQSVGSHKCS